MGRDGQEIEGECGRRLAIEIDEVGGVGVGGGEREFGGEKRNANGRGEGPFYRGEGWDRPSAREAEGW